MSRLSLYIVKECAIGALGLFGVLAALAWLTRTLRLFDLVTAKGQDMLTLTGQASLITVPLGREIIYICLAVGVARALSLMHNSRELHTIHVSGRVVALWSGIAIYAAVGTFAVILLTNWLDPLSRRQMIDWSAEIAADLVGRTLQPGRFSPVAEGVTISIGGRLADGTIVDFFADDNSDPLNRFTYFSETAEILADERGYVLILSNGMVQRAQPDGKFSSVAFSNHRLSFNRFSDFKPGGDGYNERTTFDLIEEIQELGESRFGTRWVLVQRAGDALNVGALIFFAAAVTAFPYAGRRRRWLPMEVVVIAMAFVERAIDAITHGWGPPHFLAGPAFLYGISALIVAYRILLPFGPMLPRAAR
jgi:lipopolysaccharide export system permease protein